MSDVNVRELFDSRDDSLLMRIGESVLYLAIPHAIDIDARVDGNPEERERDVIGINADKGEVDDGATALLGRRGIRMHEDIPEQVGFGLDGRELLGEILRIEDRLERIARRLLVDEHAHRRRKRQGNDSDEQDGKEHLSRLG